MKHFLGVEGEEYEEEGMRSGSTTVRRWFNQERLQSINPEVRPGGKGHLFLDNECVNVFLLRCWLWSLQQNLAAYLLWIVQLKDNHLYTEILMSPFKVPWISTHLLHSYKLALLKVPRKRRWVFDVLRWGSYGNKNPGLIF